ncbi:MAG: hypothetical protein ABI459_06380 [Deltaproteobacteria bacterium]
MNIITSALIVFACAGAAQADPIATFKQLCMQNLGNSSGAIKAGKKVGFTMITMGPGASMGFRNSTDESLQVNVATRHKFECTVTTSDMANPNAVADRFFAELGLTGRKGKAAGKIGGKTYTFMHDTKGGEAFVVYSD